MADRIIFIDEVAERFGRSIAQIRWMTHATEGFPQPAKIGGRLCWRSSAVEAFIEAAFEEVS